jgi:hypothetical protein
VSAWAGAVTPSSTSWRAETSEGALTRPAASVSVHPSLVVHYRSCDAPPRDPRANSHRRRTLSRLAEWRGHHRMAGMIDSAGRRTPRAPSLGLLGLPSRRGSRRQAVIGTQAAPGLRRSSRTPPGAGSVQVSKRLPAPRPSGIIGSHVAARVRFCSGSRVGAARRAADRVGAAGLPLPGRDFLFVVTSSPHHAALSDAPPIRSAGPLSRGRTVLCRTLPPAEGWPRRRRRTFLPTRPRPYLGHTAFATVPTDGPRDRGGGHR